jgi:nitrate reductase NapAB chaperone NapD
LEVLQRAVKDFVRLKEGGLVSYQDKGHSLVSYLEKFGHSLSPSHANQLSLVLLDSEFLRYLDLSTKLAILENFIPYVEEEDQKLVFQEKLARLTSVKKCLGLLTGTSVNNIDAGFIEVSLETLEDAYLFLEEIVSLSQVPDLNSVRTVFEEVQKWHRTAISYNEIFYKVLMNCLAL